MLTSPIDKQSVEQPRGHIVSENPVRSLAKAVSWRVAGSIDTLMLSWLFTGDLTIAAAIGLTEVVTKMVLYYLHERAWNRISFGKSALPIEERELVKDRSSNCLYEGAARIRARGKVLVRVVHGERECCDG